MNRWKSARRSAFPARVAGSENTVFPSKRPAGCPPFRHIAHVPDAGPAALEAAPEGFVDPEVGEDRRVVGIAQVHRDPPLTEKRRHEE
jgi:hypothetical protein